MNTMIPRRHALTLLALAALSTFMSTARAEDAVPLSEGEIRRIDKTGGKLTLKHGELRNLDMPAMTMAFVVRDPKGIEGLKVGDRIRFLAGQDGPTYTVESWVLAK